MTTRVRITLTFDLEPGQLEFESERVLSSEELIDYLNDNDGAEALTQIEGIAPNTVVAPLIQ